MEGSKGEAGAGKKQSGDGRIQGTPRAEVRLAQLGYWRVLRVDLGGWSVLSYT